jgi:arsenate reductase (thioredoxin)
LIPSVTGFRYLSACHLLGTALSEDFSCGDHIKAYKIFLKELEELNNMKKGVLFVCIGNSCRSIMAEALTTHYWGDAIHACSAGTYPLGHITAHTLEVLKERDVPTDRLCSKGFSAIAFDEIDLIVSLTGDLLEPLLPRSFSGDIVRWHVRDPYGEGLSVFRQTLDTIDWLIQEKLPEWLQLELAHRRDTEKS